MCAYFLLFVLPEIVSKLDHAVLDTVHTGPSSGGKESIEEIKERLNTGVSNDTFFDESKSGGHCEKSGGGHFIDAFGPLPQICPLCGKIVDSR